MSAIESNRTGYLIEKLLRDIPLFKVLDADERSCLAEVRRLPSISYQDRHVLSVSSKPRPLNSYQY